MVRKEQTDKIVPTLSRSKILEAIRQNKPTGHVLPPPPDFPAYAGDLKQAFTLVSESTGTSVVDASGKALNDVIGQLFPDAGIIFSTVDAIPNQSLDNADLADPHALHSVDLAIFQGRLAVAENGAIWLSEKEMLNRASPFIAQHLLIILDPKRLVWNMHQAYRKLKIDETGYGVFIAGPSKTADIEQSLVIGAQGARSLTVIWS